MQSAYSYELEKLQTIDITYKIFLSDMAVVEIIILTFWEVLRKHWGNSAWIIELRSKTGAAKQ